MFRVACSLSLVLLAVPSGCNTMPAESLPLVMPDTSEIPAGIYSGQIRITAVHRKNNVPQTETQDVQYTQVVDGNGRILEAGGTPFQINGKYYIDGGSFQITQTIRSITVIGTQIAVRYDLTVEATGSEDLHGTFTGTQTDTFGYITSSAELDLSRIQSYGGVASDGNVYSFIIQADGKLTRSP